MQLEWLLGIVSFILSLGSTVMMPIIVTILGIIFRQGITKSARAGIAIGIGFIGINTVLGILIGALTPITKGLVALVGWKLKAIDLSWVYPSTIAWSWWGAALIFPLFLGINIAYLMLGPKRGGGDDLDVDLWNYWEGSFVMYFAWIVTKNIMLSAAVAGVYFYVLLRLSDWGACLTQDSDTYNFPSICWPHPFAAMLPSSCFIEKYITSRIPGIRKIRGDPESLRKRFGLIADPIFIGFFIGVVLALIGYATGYVGIAGATSIVMSVAATMLLMPRMVGILMEGLLPLSDGAKEFMTKRFPGRALNIGLDWAIASGYIPIIAAGAIMVPLTLGASLIIPGNIVLPYGDLALMMCVGLWFGALAKGDMIRTLIDMIIYLPVVFYFASFFSMMTTSAALSIGMAVPAGFMVTSLIMSLCLSMVQYPIIALYLFGGETGRAIIGGGIYNPIIPFAVSVAWVIFDIISWRLCRHYPYQVAATPKEEFFEKGPRSWEEVKKTTGIYGLPKE